MIKLVVAAVSALCFTGVQVVGGESDYTCTVPVVPNPAPVTKVINPPHISPLPCKCGNTTINVHVQIHNNVHVNTHVNTHNVTQNHNNVHPNNHNKTSKK